MKRLSFILLLLLAQQKAFAQIGITAFEANASFTIVSDKEKAQIILDVDDHTLVKKSASFLANDINLVTGVQPDIVNKIPATSRHVIIIGSLDKSGLIKRLIANKKIDISNIKGKWEAFFIQVVKDPLPGIKKALVIAGTDRRGTAYGVFEISKTIGVSPWYWWADVPVPKKPFLYISGSGPVTDAPKIKYRGIFINDEAPALSNWSREKFDGFNHKFYEKVFELMLRLKANYLWPAMWGNAFYDDDKLNIKSADDFGIVIGTSHHEPLMRAHDEWRRYGNNQKWNYDSTEAGLKKFWHEGMERATNEKIVSIGMRGDGDEPMSRETATALLERIVADQRKIIADVTKKPAHQTPQLWALYKEVQDYYDKGMRVPDDVTLLLCDDNWGNIRRLPKPGDKPRKGGYGIYYHFDYVGGPRNYKWINTNSLPRIWEQMHLALEYGAREIWIVNVGDIKPMELPISFFLDYAWNPEKISHNDLASYTTSWAAQQFGKKNSERIADILNAYSKFNARTKPELLDDKTYSLANYSEFDRVTIGYKIIANWTNRLKEELPEEYHSAFYQLVQFPVLASSNLYDLYYLVARNKWAYSLRDTSTNRFANKAKQCYVKDSLLTLDYHKLNGGKWNHMMSQTHIGYTYWQQPPVQVMPEVKYLHPDSTRINRIISSGPTKSALSMIPRDYRGNVFYEEDGMVSMEAQNFTDAVNTKEIKWEILPDHGRILSAITTFPVTSPSVSLSSSSPHVQYEFYSYSHGAVNVHAYFSPTLNFLNSPTGLRFAISIDGEEPQIISLNKEDGDVRTWENWVANNIITKQSRHRLDSVGKHIIRYWMIDPGVVLQKIVIDCGGLKESYLGPLETRYWLAKKKED